jgi:hypothetical protein
MILVLVEYAARVTYKFLPRTMIISMTEKKFKLADKHLTNTVSNCFATNLPNEIAGAIHILMVRAHGELIHY